LLDNKQKKEEHQDQDSEIEESKASNSNLASQSSQYGDDVEEGDCTSNDNSFVEDEDHDLQSSQMEVEEQSLRSDQIDVKSF